MRTESHLSLPELIAESWRLFRYLIVSLGYRPERAAEVAEEWLRRATGGIYG